MQENIRKAAERLFFDYLDEQQKEYYQDNYPIFPVLGSEGGRYVLEGADTYYVEKIASNGEVTISWMCFMAYDYLPEYDQRAAEKLLLELNETLVQLTANYYHTQVLPKYHRRSMRVMDMMPYWKERLVERGLVQSWDEQSPVRPESVADPAYSDLGGSIRNRFSSL